MPALTGGMQVLSAAVSVVGGVAAAYFTYRRHRVTQAARLIRNAPAAERPRLIEMVLDDYGIDHTNLTRDQKFAYMMEQNRSRNLRYLLGIGLAALIIVAAVTAWAIGLHRPAPPPAVSPAEIETKLRGETDGGRASLLAQSLAALAKTSPEDVADALVRGGLGNQNSSVQRATQDALFGVASDPGNAGVYPRLLERLGYQFASNDPNTRARDGLETVLGRLWSQNPSPFRSALLGAEAGDDGQTAQYGIVLFLAERYRRNSDQQARKALADVAADASAPAHVREMCGTWTSGGAN